MVDMSQVMHHGAQFASSLWTILGPMLAERIPEISAAIYGAWATRDWVKLKQAAEKICGDLAGETITNDQRLESAVSAIWKITPTKLKMWPFINEKTITNMVKTIYATRVKPDIKMGKISEATVQSAVAQLPAAISTAVDFINHSGSVGDVSTNEIASGVYQITKGIVNF